MPVSAAQCRKYTVTMVSEAGFAMEEENTTVNYRTFRQASKPCAGQEEQR
jgi:hypothetical protein